MNLSSLTPEQRDCVTHVSGPLLVSAGAGSGKTLMLTQRIAYALLHPEESGVHDIDEVLAITFTELAAGEIKARVRTRLREEGLAAQALKVDASWISTIHGMCSRILRESALELGIDPQFGLLDDTDRTQLLESCVNEALVEVRGEAPEEDDDGAVRARAAFSHLFREYEKADGPSNVGAMAAALVNAAANVRGGLDAIVYAQPPSPHDIARTIHDAMISCDAAVRAGIKKNGKASEKVHEARDLLEDPEHGMIAFERLAAKQDCTYQDLAQALLQIDMGALGKSMRREDCKTPYALFRATCIEARLNCGLGIAGPARDELLALTRRVQELFDMAKARQGVLDQNDLLLKTLEAFETCPTIEERYRDRFKLVMVDEFQDTSGLQIALISHLTDNNQRLCTVGDTQQSIYRFRGADVDTYRSHKRAMRALETQGGLYRELGKNFRSHGDIIAFVNRIFGAPEVFGDSGEFIELSWVADHDTQNPFPPVPRIDLVATISADRGGVSTDDRHLVEAEAIARRFEALHADAPNQRWGDMVILLGTMKRADVYARTLRAHGIPCIVTGGSGFSWTAEAQEVGALLSALADPWDNANLRRALSGAAFGLSAEELLRLGTGTAGEQRHLWAGLLACSQDDPSPRLRLASTLLEDAVATVGSRGVAQTLTDLAVASGWLDRLQDDGPQGMASAANIFKAIRLAQSIEQDPATPRGVAATAARVAHKLAEGMKEKPGALMAAKQDAVRILTVHASKGLEFPIVALADFYGLRAQTDRLRLETAGETIYLSMAPSASVAVGSPLQELLNSSKNKLTEAQQQRLIDEGYLDLLVAPTLADAETAAELHRSIRSHAYREELGELRRKFYVGATRPREALIIAIATTSKKEPVYKDVLEDLRRGLFGTMGDYRTSPEGLAFGGETRAATERLNLERNDSGDLLVNGAPIEEFLTTEMAQDLASSDDSPETGTPACQSTATVPEPPRPGERLSDLAPHKHTSNPLRAGTFSYSFLGSKTASHEATDPDEAFGSHLSLDGEQDLDIQSVTAHNADAPSPVAFGSAFHQLCQYMVEDYAARRTSDASAELRVPSDDYLLACLGRWGLAAPMLTDLREAATLWARSSIAQKACAHPALMAETPFYVTLLGPQGEPLHLEGSIDLLACNLAVAPNQQTALVVDYKTGGSPSETPEQLQDKHGLQARCYALAVLSHGYEAVELRFVRVQRRDVQEPDQPQVVSYRFEHDDIQGLEEEVRAAYAQALEL